MPTTARSVAPPDFRLAVPGGGVKAAWNRALMTERRVPPAVLVAYPYVNGWLPCLPLVKIRSWALDSGAVTARNSGKPISLEAFTRFAREQKAIDPTLEEVFALDVLGDWRASLQNTEWMWKHGVEAIPCWHANEPEHVLLTLAATYPKIAVGAVAGMRGPERIRVLEQVFARVWPKKVHGFGIGDEKLVMKLPFHSVDASSWEIGPMRFRQFKGMGRANLRVPCKTIDLNGEVDHYLEIERRARVRWRKAMEEL